MVAFEPAVKHLHGYKISGCGQLSAVTSDKLNHKNQINENIVKLLAPK
jgi:hypothetical protein